MKDRKAWHSAVHGVAKSRTWLSDWTRRHQRAIKTAEMWGKENALQWVKSYCALFLLVHLLKYEQWAGEIDKLNEKYPWKVRELDRTLVVTPGWEVTYWQSRLLQQPDFEVQNLKGKENTLKWARLLFIIVMWYIFLVHLYSHFLFQCCFNLVSHKWHMVGFFFF